MCVKCGDGRGIGGSNALSVNAVEEKGEMRLVV